MYSVAAEAWPIPRGLSGMVDPAAPLAADELVSVFHVHYSGLCRLAYLIVGDAVLAEDVVQEAFLRTYAGWRRVREPDRADVYMRRAVVNLSRSRTRRRSIEYRSNATFHASDRHRGKTGESTATGMTVLEAVRQLPPRQRATVVLRYYLDLPESEIAEILGTAVGTVKSQLAKARRTLGQSIGGSIDD
jgi:RNA polymerase sigma-70 factor (sigma-E family)